MKLCWEATGGTPGSCVRGPLTNPLEVGLTVIESLRCTFVSHCDTTALT